MGEERRSPSNPQRDKQIAMQNMQASQGMMPGTLLQACSEGGLE